MEINRNQFFMGGLVILLLGLQFRMVDSAKLTPKFTRMLAEYSGNPTVAASDNMNSLMGTEPAKVSITYRPPEWLGWCLSSVGAVLILHSLGMRKPGG